MTWNVTNSQENSPDHAVPFLDPALWNVGFRLVVKKKKVSKESKLSRVH